MKAEGKSLQSGDPSLTLRMTVLGVRGEFFTRSQGDGNTQRLNLSRPLLMNLLHPRLLFLPQRHGEHGGCTEENKNLRASSVISVLLATKFFERCADFYRDRWKACP